MQRKTKRRSFSPYHIVSIPQLEHNSCPHLPGEPAKTAHSVYSNIARFHSLCREPCRLMASDDPNDAGRLSRLSRSFSHFGLRSSLAEKIWPFRKHSGHWPQNSFPQKLTILLQTFQDARLEHRTN